FFEGELGMAVKIPARLDQAPKFFAAHFAEEFLQTCRHARIIWSATSVQVFREPMIVMSDVEFVQTVEARRRAKNLRSRSSSGKAVYERSPALTLAELY